MALKQMWAEIRRQRAAGVPAAQIVADLQTAHGAVYTEPQLAAIVEMVPVPALLQQYRWANRVLLTLLVIGAISKLAFLSSLLDGMPGALLALVGIVLNVGGIVEVARYRRDGYLVTVLMVAMSKSNIARLAQRESALGIVLDLAFLAATGGLALRQMRVLFPRLTWRGQVRPD